MDDINQKLNSANVFLQAQAVTSICQNISSFKEKDAESIYKSEEVKRLWELVNKGSMDISVLAVDTLVGLVKNGLLPLPTAMQNFLADVASAKHPAAVVQGITQLMLLVCENETTGDEICCPFKHTPKGTNHPYVLLVTKRPELSGAIIEEVNFLLHHHNKRIQKGALKIIEPLLYHCFCLTEETVPCAYHLLTSLVASHQFLGKSLITTLSNLLMRIKVNSSQHLERKVAVLCAISRIGIETEDNSLISAVMPCLIASVPHAVKYGIPMRTVDCIMTQICSKFKQGCDISLCAIANALPFTSGTLQVNLLRIASTLLTHHDGNPVVAGRLLPSLLQILSAPCGAVEHLSAIASTLLSTIQDLPFQVSTNAQLSGNEYWESLSICFPELAIFIPSIYLCDQLIREPKCSIEWLNKLSSSVHQISAFHFSIVTSVVLYQGSTPECVQEAIKVLSKEVVKNKSIAVELFPVVLYSLEKETDPLTRLKLLYLFSSLAVNKLCVAMVTRTLLALWTCTALRPIIMRVMFDVWVVEPRIYPYLSQLVHDKTYSTEEMEVARAFVVASICKAKPSQHGEELLPLLSSFLNEHKKRDSTAQCMIALDGIITLCSSLVIDLRTAWQVIATKLEKDKRPEIIVKLCELLAIAPRVALGGTECEIFLAAVAGLLWNWAVSKIKITVNEAAYKALSKFDPSCFTLKMLPQFAKEGHVIPSHMASTPFEAAKKAEELLNYVPGLAWVKLATGCHKSHSLFVKSFLCALIEKELIALPKGVYLTAIQEAKKRGIKSVGSQPEPPSYSFLPDASFLKAVVNFSQDFSKLLKETDQKDEIEKLLGGLEMIFEALGQSLCRPFPALNWSFLNEALAGAEKASQIPSLVSDIRNGVMKIASQQCNKSASAMNITTKWTCSTKLQFEEELQLFGVLHHLGRGIKPNDLQQFISQVFSNNIDKTANLEKLLCKLKPHLSNDIIHNTNRVVLYSAVEGLNDKISSDDDKLFCAYKSCIEVLPLKNIERLTSPTVWWEVTDDKLYRAAILRCHVASSEREDDSLPWLNDIIDAAAGLPGDRNHFLFLFVETFVARSKTNESSAWLLSLLGRLREYLKRQPGENIVLAHEQQQRIVFYVDLLVLYLLIWSGLWATCSLDKLASSYKTRDELFSAGLVSLHGRPDWDKVLPQILNWLVLALSKLQPYLINRYDMSRPFLLLASLSQDISQATWNKIISISML